MAGDRQELEDLRRLDELERKASGKAPATPSPAKSSSPKLSGEMGEPFVGAAETALATGTGMAGATLGKIGGLGATAYEAARHLPQIMQGKPITDVTGAEPQQFAQDIQERLTYQPRTAYGRGGVEALGMVNKPIEKASEFLKAHRGPEGPLSFLAPGIEDIGDILALGGGRVGQRGAAALPGKQAALDVAKGEAGPLNDIRDAAQKAGYKTPPEFGVKAALSGLAGKSRAEKALSPENAENAARRMGKEVGITEGEPLSPTVFEKRKGAEYAKYNALADAVGKEVKVTDRFRQKIDNILETVEENKDVTPELKGASEVTEGFKRRISPPVEKGAPGMQRPSVAGTLEKTAQEQPGPRISRTLEQVAGESPGMPGYGRGTAPPPFMPLTAAPSPTLHTKWVMNQISDLRKRAKDDYRSGKTDVADARYTIANELEVMIEENLGTKGAGMLAEFKQARKNLAKIHLLEDVTDPAGRVNLQELGALAEKPKYKGVLDGEFKTAADFANTWRKAAAKPTGEAIPRFSVLDGLLAASSVGATVMGHAWGPALAGELALRAGVPFAAERGLLQNRTPPYIASRFPQLAGPGAGALGFIPSQGMAPQQ